MSPGHANGRVTLCYFGLCEEVCTTQYDISDAPEAALLCVQMEGRRAGFRVRATPNGCQLRRRVSIFPVLAGRRGGGATSLYLTGRSLQLPGKPNGGASGAPAERSPTLGSNSSRPSSDGSNKGPCHPPP